MSDRTTYPKSCKPCPFCGAAARMHDPLHGGVLVGCSNDGCRVQPSVAGESKASATRAWNRRNGGAA